MGLWAKTVFVFLFVCFFFLNCKKFSGTRPLRGRSAFLRGRAASCAAAQHSCAGAQRVSGIFFFQPLFSDFFVFLYRLLTSKGSYNNNSWVASHAALLFRH